MPLRYVPVHRAVVLGEGLLAPAIAWRQLDGKRCTSRGLRTSHVLYDDAKNNHYETLNVAPDATPAKIKKSFYSLSKVHHPDHNRSDPTASQRFMRISEAYSVIGNSDKRARYDRDVMHLQQQQERAGSYHSSGPAGGRPASGLSRRRSAFQGPPPSFFRSGGWGAQSAKREAAYAKRTGHDFRNSKPAEGGMGPGQDPLGRRAGAAHFDQVAHERTHWRTEASRRARKEQPLPFETRGMVGFSAIMGILGIGLTAPLIMGTTWSAVTSPSATGRSAR